ncbi:hypothetical protein [Stenotrophomonas sp.]|uniref:hypothetical protein n=1 Tax=Stenotrophomonas sp. TaxID=69392 RepID=UPI0028AD837A|nr:hypothetical protein [Stenotrophomonas sp.]
MSRNMPIRNTLCVAFLSSIALLAGCSAPKPTEPSGKWMPVNRMAEAPQAIPLHASYLYQASPVDGTLKGMLTRWAKDSGLTLSYLHPNDYTLFGPVADIHTISVAEAAAALSAAYAAQGVLVVVERQQIIVSVAAVSNDTAGPQAGSAADAAGK